MGQHEDLFAAALQAVNAVEAQSEGKPSDDEGNDESLSETVPRFKTSEENLTRDEGESSASESLLETYSARISELEKQLKEVREDADKMRRQNEILTKGKSVLEETISLSKKEREELSAQLEKEKKDRALLEQTVRQSTDRSIRVTADFDNYRKRVARDQERMQQQAEEKIMTAFLPVMDNLERALMHSTQTDDGTQLLQGLKMTGKMFLSTLAKFGCMQFKSVGEAFNPAFHEVLQRVIDAEAPHNSIVQEHLSGYLMNQRVLRPALVVVAQHPEPEETAAEEKDETADEISAAVSEALFDDPEEGIDNAVVDSTDTADSEESGSVAENGAEGINEGEV